MLLSPRPGGKPSNEIRRGETLRDVYIQSGSVTLRHLGAIASHIQHMAPIPLAQFQGRSHGNQTDPYLRPLSPISLCTPWICSRREFWVVLHIIVVASGSRSSHSQINVIFKLTQRVRPTPTLAPPPSNTPPVMRRLRGLTNQSPAEGSDRCTPHPHPTNPRLQPHACYSRVPTRKSTLAQLPSSTSDG